MWPYVVLLKLSVIIMLSDKNGKVVKAVIVFTGL